MTLSITVSKLARRVLPIAALGALVLAMGGTWATAQPTTLPSARSAAASTTAPGTTRAAAGASTRAASAKDTAAEPKEKKRASKELTGKLNLNTATEEQLMLLPTVGPSKAERVITWRKKNGGFKRVADLRRVKGFGYKTFKRLEPYLDITGETTLAAKR